MLKNRHIAYYVVSLIMMGTIGCKTSLSAQSIYINTAGTTVETRFKLPEGYERVPATKNSYTSFLRRLRLMTYGSATYNNSASETPQIGLLNLSVIENMQENIHLCIRLRSEYFFEREQYNKIAFSIITKDRVDYIRWSEGLNIAINGKLHSTKQQRGVNRIITFQNFLKFIFTHSTIKTIMLDVQPTPISNIMPGDMFIQPEHPGNAVIVLDVAYNRATGDRIFLLAKHNKRSQIAYVLDNPKEGWSGSPWYHANIKGNKITTPDFVFYKTDLRRFQENGTTTTAKK